MTREQFEKAKRKLEEIEEAENVIAQLRMVEDDGAILWLERADKTGRRFTVPPHLCEKFLSLLRLHYKTIKELAETEFAKL